MESNQNATVNEQEISEKLRILIEDCVYQRAFLDRAVTWRDECDLRDVFDPNTTRLSTYIDQMTSVIYQRWKTYYDSNPVSNVDDEDGDEDGDKDTIFNFVKGFDLFECIEDQDEYTSDVVNAVYKIFPKRPVVQYGYILSNHKMAPGDICDLHVTVTYKSPSGCFFNIPENMHGVFYVYQVSYMSTELNPKPTVVKEHSMLTLNS